MKNFETLKNGFLFKKSDFINNEVAIYKAICEKISKKYNVLNLTVYKLKNNNKRVQYCAVDNMVIFRPSFKYDEKKLYAENLENLEKQLIFAFKYICGKRFINVNLVD